MAVLHDYVKQNGKQFVYSQLAIDLVQQYMDRFPRVFELLNSSESKSCIRVSEFENGKQSALDNLNEIRDWLNSLPISKAKRTSLESMQLSNNAIKHVQFAVHSTVSEKTFIPNLLLKSIELNENRKLNEINFGIAWNRGKNSPAQNEMGKSLRSGSEQCFCGSESEYNV